MNLQAVGGDMTIHDDLAELFEERKELGMRIPSFDPYSLTEPVCAQWLRFLSAETDQESLVRKLVAEQHS